MTAVAPVMIMAGGTGGHVIPALSVADVLRARGVPVVWLGTQQGIEAKLVPAAGITIRWLSISGLRGKGRLTLLAAPFRIVRAIWQALRIIRAEQPQAVLGLGGFAAGPGGVAAKLLGKRLVIHEQNAAAGMTNRLLARIADYVAVAFTNALPNSEHTGNPVRETIEQLAVPEQRFAGRNGKLRVLILGGSQGAVALNDTVPKAVAMMQHAEQLDIRHQCGARHADNAAALYENTACTAVVLPFIDDMAATYAWADLVICRSGALTVAEVTAAGLAALFVPFPAAVDDHQTKNAAALVEAGAAQLLPQASLTPALLAQKLAGFVADRADLLPMAQAARQCHRTGAATRLADLCLLPHAALQGAAA